MATVAAIPIPMPISPRDDRHTPILSTIDPSFSPGSLHLQPYTKPSTSPSNTSPIGSFSSSGTSSPQLAVPMGSRNEKVPYDGPGTAVYVRQPTRAQLVSLAVVLRRARAPATTSWLTLSSLVPLSGRTTACSARPTGPTTTKIRAASPSSTLTARNADRGGSTSTRRQVRTKRVARPRLAAASCSFGSARRFSPAIYRTSSSSKPPSLSPVVPSTARSRFEEGAGLVSL
ncbi:hypothetical protein AAT19DRAFT_8898 [Rhodotorula toruloides]|uniref:Uncharacterized protein n=1 Tax=Rhodotorula toruloides TaxID=5286 RepID=A0A2T0AIP7_RHOTO|nr:hypothetical protein AAT19DRAFT_8898 [Rhodotorula toruloides]